MQIDIKKRALRPLKHLRRVAALGRAEIARDMMADDGSGGQLRNELFKYVRVGFFLRLLRGVAPV